MDTNDVPQPQGEMLVHYCDRCARRSLKLLSDDLSLQQLCPECYRQLNQRRTIHAQSTKPRR